MLLNDAHNIVVVDLGDLLNELGWVHLVEHRHDLLVIVVDVRGSTASDLETGSLLQSSLATPR